MKEFIPFVLLSAAVVGLVVMSGRTVSGQAAAPGRLAIFADFALFSGNNQPRNCFTMNRYKVGEPVGFRVTVVDGMTGQPAADAEVVVHLTYGGKTVDVPARYRGTGRGNLTPNLWTAKWAVPADAPTGVIQVTVTATDKSGRSAEWKPFPNVASHLTVVNE
jgi:hypothetical protein